MYRWAVVSGRYVRFFLLPLTLNSRSDAMWQAWPHKQTIYFMYFTPPHLSFVILKTVEDDGIGCVFIKLRSVMN